MVSNITGRKLSDPSFPRVPHDQLTGEELVPLVGQGNLVTKLQDVIIRTISEHMRTVNHVPLESGTLQAIAQLATTPFGRELLELADAIALAKLLTPGAIGAISETDTRLQDIHRQNTDTGTVQHSFQLDSEKNGARLKNNEGAIEVRNGSDSSYADLRVANLTVEGTQTIVNSENVAIADNIITLNSDVTGAPVQDAGLEVNRGTGVLARFIWSESNQKFLAGLAGSEQTIILSNDLKALALKDTIANVDVAANAAIAWDKISKVGANPSDIGALSATDIRVINRGFHYYQVDLPSNPLPGERWAELNSNGMLIDEWIYNGTRWIGPHSLTAGSPQSSITTYPTAVFWGYLGTKYDILVERVALNYNQASGFVDKTTYCSARYQLTGTQHDQTNSTIPGNYREIGIVNQASAIGSTHLDVNRILATGPSHYAIGTHVTKVGTGTTSTFFSSFGVQYRWVRKVVQTP